MPTSGTTAFTLDLAEIIEESYERCGAEMLNGYDFRTARRSLNLLFMDWANRGVNLWTLDSSSIPLLTGVGTYNLPEDTVDLLDCVIRTNPGDVSRQQDLPISRVRFVTYNTIPNKLSQSRPLQMLVKRNVGVPTVTVWPVPADDTYTFVYWRLRRMQDAGTGATTHDVPFRLIPALTSGLAYYLSFKVKDALVRAEMLKAVYEEDWTRASDEDREKAPVRIVPYVGRL
mgnify:FL=1